MKKIIFFLSILILINWSCCNQSKPSQQVDGSIIAEKMSPDTAHSSENSLDWAGTYKGILPCADCEGIETELTLNKNLTFVILTNYLGKADSKFFEEKGSFSWNENGSKIILLGIENRPNAYFVGENKLFQLDMDGNRIDGALANKYILIKQ